MPIYKRAGPLFLFLSLILLIPSTYAVDHGGGYSVDTGFVLRIGPVIDADAILLDTPRTDRKLERIIFNLKSGGIPAVAYLILNDYRTGVGIWPHDLLKVGNRYVIDGGEPVYARGDKPDWFTPIHIT